MAGERAASEDKVKPSLKLPSVEPLLIRVKNILKDAKNYSEKEKSKKYLEAITECTEIHEQLKKNNAIIKESGEYKVNQRKLEHFEGALLVDSRDGDALAGRERAISILKWYNDQLHYLDIKKERNYLYWGEAYEALGNYKEAGKSYKLASSSNRFEGHIQRGKYLIRQAGRSQEEQAKDCYRRALNSFKMAQALVKDDPQQQQVIREAMQQIPPGISEDEEALQLHHRKPSNSSDISNISMPGQSWTVYLEVSSEEKVAIIIKHQDAIGKMVVVDEFYPIPPQEGARCRRNQLKLDDLERRGGELHKTDIKANIGQRLLSGLVADCKQEQASLCSQPTPPPFDPLRWCARHITAEIGTPEMLEVISGRQAAPERPPRQSVAGAASSALK